MDEVAKLPQYRDSYPLVHNAGWNSEARVSISSS